MDENKLYEIMGRLYAGFHSSNESITQLRDIVTNLQRQLQDNDDEVGANELPVSE